ncbi:MAG: lysoplasmalogenase [Pedobacter sp.]
MVILTRHLVCTSVFVIIALLQLTGHLIDSEVLIVYTKPLITVCLAIFLIATTAIKGRFHKRILSGLVFALIGDLLLSGASSNEKYFSYVIFAFSLCHIFYIRAFYLDFLSAPELDKKLARWTTIIVAISSTVFFFYLRPYLGAMRVPVLAYILIISLLVLMAVFRNQRVNKLSFNLIVVGALCFVASDALLAYDKFIFSFGGSKILIMITYMTAQYLITLGAVERRLMIKE